MNKIKPIGFITIIIGLILIGCSLNNNLRLDLSIPGIILAFIGSLFAASYDNPYDY